MLSPHLARENHEADPGAIFDRAIALLLERVEKQKLGAATKPRAPRPIRPGTDHPVSGGENISLRCRRHDQYEAELVFGPRTKAIEGDA
jgi:hypothetical protein